MDELRFGLLGCGPTAQFAHLPALDRAKNVRLTAIYDGAEYLLQTISRCTGVERIYTDHRELLEYPDIDPVLIAVPDLFHVPMAIDALRAGKHVLVEKSLGATLTSVKEHYQG